MRDERTSLMMGVILAAAFLLFTFGAPLAAM